jgi:uncharacterized protein
MLNRRTLLAAALGFATRPARAMTWADRLVAAAETQIGRTIIYDPAYVRIRYPGGDIPVERGVCTDVVIRAYRDGLGLDLQRLVHEDMRRNFSAYPSAWGLKKPDRNIDHRRVPNLQRFFQRSGASLAVSLEAAGYVAGDLVTMMLPGNLPHIGIVAHERNDDGSRPMIIHNIGAGTKRQDILFEYEVTGHYRFHP